MIAFFLRVGLLSCPCEAQREGAIFFTQKIMEELIKVSQTEKGQVVSARDLHKFLENTDNVNTWFSRQAERAMLIEGEDFIAISQQSTGGRPSIDYAIKINAAKEISMLNGGDKGKQARLYFIECERKSKQEIKPLSPAEQLLANAQLLVEIERKQQAIQNQLDVIQAKQISINTEYFTVSGYCNLKKIKIDSSQANLKGRQCAKLSRELEYHIGKYYDAKFGEVNTYHLEVLYEIFK